MPRRKSKLRSIHDLLHLRWRTAQWLLAVTDGDIEQLKALNKAMAVEGIARRDVLDEHELLRHQFAHRPRHYLAHEVSRLWRHIAQLCVRCGRRSGHLDNDHVCVDCVLEEARG